MKLLACLFLLGLFVAAGVIVGTVGALALMLSLPGWFRTLRFRLRQRLGLCRNRRRSSASPLRLRGYATTPLTFTPDSWGHE
jgi:hypothetical protein